MHISVLIPPNVDIPCWKDIYLKILEEEKRLSSFGYSCEIDKKLLSMCVTQINPSKSIFTKLVGKFFNRKIH